MAQAVAQFSAYASGLRQRSTATLGRKARQRRLGYASELVSAVLSMPVKFCARWPVLVGGWFSSSGGIWMMPIGGKPGGAQRASGTMQPPT